MVNRYDVELNIITTADKIKPGILSGVLYNTKNRILFDPLPKVIKLVNQVKGAYILEYNQNSLLDLIRVVRYIRDFKMDNSIIFLKGNNNQGLLHLFSTPEFKYTEIYSYDDVFIYRDPKLRGRR